MSNSDKKCIILHDEMSIMTDIEYNKSLDLIEGFEDLGTQGRTPKVAKHALVIMVRGLYKNWKFPFCYFLANNGVNGNNLSILNLNKGQWTQHPDGSRKLTLGRKQCDHSYDVVRTSM